MIYAIAVRTMMMRLVKIILEKNPDDDSNDDNDHSNDCNGNNDEK